MVMAIQILPIQQMGRMLFSNQFTEEIPHSLDIEKSDFKKGNIKSDFLGTAPLAITVAFIELPSQHCYFADAIPKNYTDDIHVPPPNC
jgi:hypothetical protein